jgi:two-component system, OmpR family, sensor histidine kinase VicK
MRWWLALSFAAVVSLTAVVVAEVFTARAEGEFRARAKELSAGSAFSAASEITHARTLAQLRRIVADNAARRRLALFAFDAQRRPITPERSRGFDARRVPFRAAALDHALDGRRFVETSDDGRTIVVGLQLRGEVGAALVAVASRPDLVAEIGILRSQIVTAALWAVFTGAAAGLVVALLIAARLRRIAAAAAEIEGGSFDTELRPRFRDELGDLAATVDRMRERLRESFGSLESERDSLRVLLEQLHDGVIAVDRRLTVVVANAAARRMALGGKVVDREPLPEPDMDSALRAFASRLFEPGAGLSQMRFSPDEDLVYAVVGIPPSPSSPLAVIVLTDVTERVRRERAEREFVGNAAHELRTPIAAIASALEALDIGAKDVPEDRDHFLEIAHRQTDRLGRLVRALLALSRAQTRQETVRVDTLVVRPVLDEVAAMLEVPAGVSVEVDSPPELAVLAQRDLAAQVVTNLATNAAKHTKRGSVRLSAGTAPDGAVVIEVRDTGEGIPQAERDRIYDRFHSGHGGQREGFGLGLAIVREAVRALGGTVEIESEPGKGTVARVTLVNAHSEAA